eukprot:1101429-Amphidinium_carterae.1
MPPEIPAPWPTHSSPQKCLCHSDIRDPRCQAEVAVARANRTITWRSPQSILGSKGDSPLQVWAAFTQETPTSRLN